MTVLLDTRITPDALDPAVASAWLHQDQQDSGAVVLFSGLVRSDQGTVAGMTLEHYPGLSDRMLAELAERVARHWGCHRVLAWHRIGDMRPGEVIVLVGVAAAHRAEAFEAAQCLMDLVKVRIPLWKKTTGPAGPLWVDARSKDQEAAARWAWLDGITGTGPSAR